MSADGSFGVIPSPGERQRAAHRHTDSPSLADLVAVVEKAAQAETRKLAAALRGLAALADDFEAEAREEPPTETGNAKALKLQMCARRLREAIARGVTG